MTEQNRHQQLGLSDEKVLDMYESMLLARRIDERMWLLNRAGKVPFVVSCQGQEAAQIGAGYALDREVDYLLPYYRDLGLVLTFGMSPKDVFLSGFAKAEDPNSGGKQMPGHYGQRKHRIVTGSSPVTTQVPHAAGIALAARMDGSKAVSLVAFGEGSSNQGDFHEGANFAGVHKLPVILFCQNNHYAISVPLEKQLACEKVSDRAAGYGMPGRTVDGSDPLSVFETVKEAADRAREGKGPTLIEVVCHRLTAHSSDDDHSGYRSAADLEDLKSKDPIPLFSAYLRECGVLDDKLEKEIEDRVMLQVNEATDYAEQAPYAAPEDALAHVYRQEED